MSKNIKETKRARPKIKSFRPKISAIHENELSKIRLDELIPKPEKIIYKYITNKNQDIHQVELDEDATIESLKMVIAKQFSVSNISDIHVLFAGKDLENDILVEQLEVGDFPFQVYIYSNDELFLKSARALKIRNDEYEYSYEYDYEEESQKSSSKSKSQNKSEYKNKSISSDENLYNFEYKRSIRNIRIDGSDTPLNNLLILIEETFNISPEQEENITLGYINRYSIEKPIKDLNEKIKNYEGKTIKIHTKNKNPEQKKEQENVFIDTEKAKKYKVIGKIGEGMTSIVYKIIEKRTLKPFCKKVLKIEGSEFKDVQNAIKEFEILHNLKHPCICSAIGINTIEKVDDESEVTTIAIYIEFVEFKLKDCLSQGILNDTSKARIITEIVHGMKYIHDKGLIYRDLKIDNVMLDSNHQVKLIDFGLAKVNEILFGIDEMNTLTLTKKVGMDDFMSPEMFNGDDYDNKTDVFSFGIILYYVVFGRMPSYGMKERSSGANVPIPKNSKMVTNCCLKLLSSCLSIDPKLRPSFRVILQYLRENKFMILPNVDSDFVSKCDTELEPI